MTLLRLFVLVAIVASITAPARAGDEARDAAGKPAAEAPAKKAAAPQGRWSPERVWEDFLDHWTAAGNEEPAKPDLAAGDPIYPVLLRQSNNLMKLQDLLESKERTPERAARLESLLKALAEDKDPYIQEYGKFFKLQETVEQGHGKEALPDLKAMLRSPRFLGHAEVHKEMARAYLQAGDSTMAILELRFYLNQVPSGHFAEERWAKEQLREISKNHKGPLQDCAERADSIAKSLEDGSNETAVKVAPAGQQNVEGILEKAIELLENGKASSQPPPQGAGQEESGQQSPEGQKGQKSPKGQGGKKGQKGQQGKQGQGQGKGEQGEGQGEGQGQGQEPGQGQGQAGGGQKKLEEILETTIAVLEDAANRGQGKGKGKMKVKQKGKEGEGDPEDEGKDPAKDTQIKDEKGRDSNLRDRKEGENEAWGQINDREVAKSLRELWGKIPASYRSLVVQYFKDITDLEEKK